MSLLANLDLPVLGRPRQAAASPVRRVEAAGPPRPVTPVAPLDPNVALFNSRRVRRAGEGPTLYAAVDVVSRLGGEASRDWPRLRYALGLSPTLVTFDDPGADAEPAELEALGRPEVLRVAAAMDTPAARRVQAWMAQTAASEIASPEPIKLTRPDREGAARLAYARAGRPDRWVRSRQAAKGPRQELAAEWAARGVAESGQYRELTNALFAEAFGLDVAAYRRHKGLGDRAKLRDHMTAAELTLVSLAESLAADVIRRRDARGFDELMSATREAGRAASAARTAAEASFGEAAVSRAA